jgi:sec-independent protein translocase protein TatA
MPMGGIELIAVLAILLLLFGAKRVPQLARSLGVGARELKKAASQEEENDADKSETKAASEGTKAPPEGVVDGDETKQAVPEGVDGERPQKVSEDPPSERDGARGDRAH